MMMTISAPPTNPPITEAETREDVASGVEGGGMAAWSCIFANGRVIAVMFECQMNRVFYTVLL